MQNFLKLMKITVAIPTYKPNFLSEAIQSVVDQTYEDWELVIVNDHSPFDIIDIVNKFKDDRIKYFVNEINCGAVDVVDNWNKCLFNSTGKYILLMGDDDMLPKDSLSNYAELIAAYPNYDVYHGRAILIDEHSEPIYIQDGRPTVESLCAAIWQRIDGRQQFIGDYIFRVASLRDCGGYYKLPLAWGSDDISVFRAIGNKGIANTNKVSFCYRVNRYSISSSGNADLKIRATFIHYDYLSKILKSVSAKGIDRVLQRLAINRLDNYFIKKRIHIVAEDVVSKGCYRIIRWIQRRKEIQLSIKFIALAFIEAYKLKQATSQNN